MYVVSVGIALSPLLWTSVLPQTDYPDHLARMAVLVNHDPNAAIAQNYKVHWRLVPNLAFDMVVPVLTRIVPLDVAGRLFVAFYMIMLFDGTAALHRLPHGKIGLWPLWSVLFLYNFLLNMIFGFA